MENRFTTCTRLVDLYLLYTVHLILSDTYVSSVEPGLIDSLELGMICSIYCTLQKELVVVGKVVHSLNSIPPIIFKVDMTTSCLIERR